MQYEFLNINFTGPFGLRMHFVFHCYSHFVFSNGSTLIFKTINSLDFLKLHQHLGSILFGIDEHKCIFIKDFFSCCFVSHLLLLFILLLAIFFVKRSLSHSLSLSPFILRLSASSISFSRKLTNQ